MTDQPHEAVARHYMTHKGLGQLEPIQIEHNGQWDWSFFYELPEGQLELSVIWTPEKGWSAQSVDFMLNDASRGD